MEGFPRLTPRRIEDPLQTNLGAIVMNAATESSMELEPVLAGVDAESWAPGSAVVALGRDGAGLEAVAVWQLSPLATPTGAWIRPLPELVQSPVEARRVLALLERRAITAARGDLVNDLLGQLSTAAEIGGESWWADQTFSPVQSLRELSARRTAVEETVAATKRQRKNIAAVQWTRELVADPLPEDFTGLRRLTGVAPAPGAPVISEALTVSRVLGWLARLWIETEQVKNRRSYVYEAHGAPEQLPPSWLTAVQTASTTRLPL